jgi:hypothetical protein
MRGKNLRIHFSGLLQSLVVPFPQECLLFLQVCLLFLVCFYFLEIYFPASVFIFLQKCVLSFLQGVFTFPQFIFPASVLILLQECFLLFLLCKFLCFPFRKVCLFFLPVCLLSYTCEFDFIPAIVFYFML